MGKKNKIKDEYAKAHPAWAQKRRTFGWHCLGMANHLKHAYRPEPDDGCGNLLDGDEYKLYKAANKSLRVTEKLYRSLAKRLLKGEGIYTDG